MELILGTSLVAAFIAGIAALFAPCCITVLLPSYLASIFKEKKKVFLMTFVFFLGILTVFLPLGLGLSAVGQLFARYHRTIFFVAGAFFLLLGSMLVFGKRVSFKMKGHPALAKSSAWSVYVLGIFSGIATTCCAPVLAGVFALSILPGSLIWGGIYTLAYVLGMVLPLFVIAAFLDKAHFSQKMMKAGVAVKLPWGEVTIPEIVSGATFLVMGALTLVAAAKNTVASHGGYQLSINIFLAKLQLNIAGFVGMVPGIVWATVIVSLAAAIVIAALRQRAGQLEKEEITKDQPIKSSCCHEEK